MGIIAASAKSINALQSLRNFHFSDLTPLACARAAVFVLGKVCLILALIFANKLGGIFSTDYSFKRTGSAEKLKEPGADELSSKEEQERAARGLNDYKGLLNDQIFNLNRQAAVLTPSATAAAPSNLSLIAVNQSSDGTGFAIIEDNSKKVQDVFGLNDTVFTQGIIKAIQNDAVKLERNGKVELLTLKDPLPGLGSADNAGDAEQTDFSISDEEVSAALANLPQLMTQARAVPYFRNGKSIGLRMFAIQMGSIYQKLGLKNGDILLAINDNDLGDPTKALTLFEQLKSERSLNVKLERESRNLDMRYTIR